MAITVDQLNIELTANSQTASTAIEQLAKSLERLQAILSGVASSNKAVSTSFKGQAANANAAAKSINNYNTASKSATKTTQALTQRLAQKISTTMILVSVFRSAARAMGEWLKESNDYIESVNLFNVTMGEGADAARRYADSVSAAMGIDVKEWMQYQGTFKNLAAGFGVAADKADVMSQNLTQLSYDMASFFNTDVETAFDKLSSAMAGQVKGLREFGIDTTVASLQEYALSKGIDAKVRSMSQAEKALLRYNYIVEKSIIMQGDMARTIITPANSLRILSAQLTQMKRALGNVISVIVVRFIPYIQAMVQVITQAAASLARLFGFNAEDFEADLSGLGGGLAGGFEDAEESLDGVSGSLNKIKKQLMGFDELNIINNPENGGGGGSGSGGIGGAGLDLDALEYDFLKNLKMTKIDELKEKMSDILKDVGSIGTAIAGWKLLNFSKELALVHPQLAAILKTVAGVAISIAGFSLEFSGAKEIGNGTAGLWDYIKTAIGAALGIAGSLIVFGTGPLGWTIGIVGAVSIFLVGFSIGYNEKQVREDLESRFGDIALTVEEVKNYAEKITTSEISLKIDLYVEEKDLLDNLKKNLEEAMNTLQRYNFRVKLGLTVDQSSYESAVDNYIQQATDYLTQKQIVAALSVDILLGGTPEGDSLSEFAASFYTAQQQKLSELGTKLKSAVSEGFVGGVWIEDKFKEAVKLQEEIQAILQYVSDVEYEAQLTAIKMDAVGIEMNAESFKGILQDAEETIQAQMDNLEGIRLENLKVAKMQFDENIKNGKAEAEAKDLYDKAVAAAQEEFLNGKLELEYGTINFGLDTLMGKFETELKTAEPVFGTTFQDVFESGMMMGVRNADEIYEQPLHVLMADLESAYYTQMSELDISSAARQNIAELVAELQPSKKQLQEIADNSIKAGETVPEYVCKGLSNFAKLEAIADASEVPNHIIGEMLSTDSSFLDLLATAEDAGKNINENTARGLLSNLQVVEDAANGTITLINDTIGEKTYQITPELVQNLKDLGVNLTEGLYDGIEEEHNEKKSLWDKICDFFGWDFKTKNEINSPSKLFYRYGENIIQGLWNGLSSMWNQLKTWWNGLSLASLKIKTPHITWTYENVKDGFMKSLLTKLNLPTSVPKMNISWYADGGFPNMGEMFIAREAGPELVGSIGNKTAVANNDQIIAGIEGGVYRAMMAANATKQGGSQTIRIINEIDGDVVGEKVIEYHNGRVLQTGASPLLV